MPLNIVDDGDPKITYYPEDAWNTDCKCGDCHQGTCHTSKQSGATIEVQFEGTFIQILGRPMDPPEDRLSVSYQLDNNTEEDCSPLPFVNQMLCQAATLPGSHTLNITFNKANNYSSFSFDYFAIQGQPESDPPTSPSASPSASSSASSSASTESPSSPSDGKGKIGAIVGGVIAALVVLAALVLFVLHWRRRQRRTDARHSITPFHIPPSEKPSSPPPMTPPMTPPSATPALAATQPPPLVTVTRAQPTSSEFSPTSLPPPSFSLSSPTIEDEPPPPFVAGTSSDVVRHPSMYKPRSMESLPPTEYGYGGGLMLPTWRRNQDRHQPS
ncbi:hypothetical protein PQX77_010584 [Marasmius sp. AFHP31]|nr:hypothetical protein PQX77_010584 [Marasmius sp. AFHP31]